MLATDTYTCWVEPARTLPEDGLALSQPLFTPRICEMDICVVSVAGALMLSDQFNVCFPGFATVNSSGGGELEPSVAVKERTAGLNDSTGPPLGRGSTLIVTLIVRGGSTLENRVMLPRLFPGLRLVR